MRVLWIFELFLNPEDLTYLAKELYRGPFSVSSFLGEPYLKIHLSVISTAMS